MEAMIGGSVYLVVLRTKTAAKASWRDRLIATSVGVMAHIEAKDVLVLVMHPHGDLWVPLADWMRIGPGPRPLLRPAAAKHAATGELLPLAVVPLQYRNNYLSRALIHVGVMTNPWAAQNDL